MIGLKNNDRFKKISHNYGDLFEEVFSVQGLDYSRFERTIFDLAKKEYSNIIAASILDIGVGDGKTSEFFVKAGCENITGIDLNNEMLIEARKRLGSKINLIKMDATDMRDFKHKQFDVIITSLCIHNIPRKARNNFWNELKRLSPKIFICAEKIADENLEKHKNSYEREINALKEIYETKYGLKDAALEWIKHYEYDEKEKLTLKEIKDNLKKDYDLSVELEMGMVKIILAKKI